ncbi:replication initiation protein [Rugamonas aquatica]|uniref:Replication protein A n=1 Tax=Rugamonas aquatica TaxID=2743357 RepID=A0A6A7N6R6_9BURK|nr:replication initiation protein [Rugamonas aquatica]MQA40679.1 replication protein A [Rugamonas aquatica]
MRAHASVEYQLVPTPAVLVQDIPAAGSPGLADQQDIPFTNPRLFQPGTALNRVLLEAPYKTRCSYNKTAGIVRPREYAVRFPYMQVNRSTMVTSLVFDLDHSYYLIWEKVGLPPPNLSVLDRNSGTCHLYYFITPVCTSDAARSKPIEYLKAVYKAMALLLEADKDYHSGPVSKTPGHPWWDTRELHNHVYELGELAGFVDLERPTPWVARKERKDNAHSRHCQLFDQLRYYAYSIVNRYRDAGSYEQFVRDLELAAEKNNDFTSRGHSANLPQSSLRSTVKSIGRWTWAHYNGNASCHRGAMQLDPDLPLPEKQRLAAVRTHERRQAATGERIRDACRQLQAAGERMTQAAIGLLAGLSRQTVAAYKEIIEAVRSSVETTPKDPGDVKDAAYQVSAADVLGCSAPFLAVAGLPSLFCDVEAQDVLAGVLPLQSIVVRGSG